MQHVLEPHGVTDYHSYSKGIEEYIAAKRQFPPHLTYANVAKFMTVDLDRFFKFAFVRNPWDRYVSLYEYFRNDTEHAMHDRCRSCSFEDFVDDVTAGRATFETKNQVKYIAPPGRMGPLDFVGKVENILLDFSFVCRKLGIEDAALPVLNTTSHRPYQSYYSDALRRKIEQYSEPDISAFGYTY